MTRDRTDPWKEFSLTLFRIETVQVFKNCSVWQVARDIDREISRVGHLWNETIIPSVHSLSCAAPIPLEHHAHHLFNLKEVAFFKRLLCFHATFQPREMFLLSTIHTGTKVWLSGIKKWWSMIKLFFQYNKIFWVLWATRNGKYGRVSSASCRISKITFVKPIMLSPGFHLATTKSCLQNVCRWRGSESRQVVGDVPLPSLNHRVTDANEDDRVSSTAGPTRIITRLVGRITTEDNVWVAKRRTSKNCWIRSVALTVGFGRWKKVSVKNSQICRYTFANQKELQSTSRP